MRITFTYKGETETIDVDEFTVGEVTVKEGDRIQIISSVIDKKPKVGDKIIVTGFVKKASTQDWCKRVVGHTGIIIERRPCRESAQCRKGCLSPIPGVGYIVKFDLPNNHTGYMCWNKFELLNKPKNILQPKLRKSHKVT